jgi:ATP-dependent Lon protease
MNDTTQTSATEQAASSELKLPDRALIILPTRNAVLFPGVVAPLGLGRPQSIAGAQASARADKPIGVVLQKDPSTCIASARWPKSCVT